MTSQPTPEAPPLSVTMRMQALMGCLSWGVAYYEKGLPVTCRTHKVQWTDAGCPKAVTAAADLLPFIRDAIHRDGADADAIRQALGLSAETVMGARWVDDGPCNQTCGFVVCGPDHRRQRIQWADRRRVVGDWQEVPE